MSLPVAATSRRLLLQNFVAAKCTIAAAQICNDKKYFAVTNLSSVQSFDGVKGDMRDDSAEILFQSFLQEALVSSSGIGRYSLQGVLEDGFG